MKKKKNQTPLKKSSMLSEQLSRYKFAERNKDITLKKKSSHGTLMEISGKTKTGQALLEQGLERYFSVHFDGHSSPFISDMPVTGSSRLNRQKEMEWALGQIQNQSLVLLYGPTGFGKTSVAIALQEELKKNNDLVVGYVSFSEATCEWDLIKQYVEAMYRAMGVPDYRWGITDQYNFSSQFLSDFYEMPTAFAKRLGKKLIAIVDDFSTVYELPDAPVIEAKFRAAWQPDAVNQKHISAIVLQDITYARLTRTSRRRALEDTGTVRYFEILSPDLWITEIKKKFETGHKTIDDSVILHLIEKMNHIPKRIQSLCHELFITKSMVITKRLVDKTINHLLKRVSLVYEGRLGLLTKLQQGVLYSIADKTEWNIPPSKLFKTYLTLDEFVFHHKNEWVFRDPFLEIYILQRNKITPKLFAKNWEKHKKLKEKNFDNTEWTWK